MKRLAFLLPALIAGFMLNFNPSTPGVGNIRVDTLKVLYAIRYPDGSLQITAASGGSASQAAIDSTVTVRGVKVVMQNNHFLLPKTPDSLLVGPVFKGSPFDTVATLADIRAALGAHDTVKVSSSAKAVATSSTTRIAVYVNIPSNANRGIFVDISKGNAAAPSSVTLKSTSAAFTQVGVTATYHYVYWLTGPAAGGDSVIVALSPGAAITVFAVTTYNVSQTTPYANFTSTSGTGTSGSITLAAVSRGLIMSAMGSTSGPSNYVASGSGNSIVIYDQTNTDGEDGCVGQSIGANPGFSWTGNIDFAIYGFQVNPSN